MVSGEAMLTQLRRGTLEYCVLGLLRAEERYAFDLVRELSDRGLVASEGTVYPLLTRLRKDELVETTWHESPSGPPRRYYRLTRAGEHRLARFTSEWARFRSTVDTILLGEEAP